MTVAICMGSDSDYPTMEGAVEILRELGVEHDVRVLSAHRMPHEMLAFGTDAAASGYKVIIAGAGGAAHLPGMLASVTTLPVIGVPVDITALDGMDSLLSIVQMPRGIPVATVAIGGAANAGLLAARILATSDEALAGKLRDYAQELEAEARAKNDRLPRGEQTFGFRNG
ncbi:MAG: 5-(carboxyamino)imidazole ribonucleotide mutase [Actinobacteria bacterium]|nr:5-(carboxyamino)imidazole ribonucleotide mutase [Actinomycetota bacterium]